MRASPNRRQADLAPNLGVDQGLGDELLVDGGALRHERVADPGRGHCQNPVVSITPVDGVRTTAMLIETLSEEFGDLAIDPPQIVLGLQIGDPHRVHVREAVIGADHNDEPLAKKRQVVQMRLPLVFGRRNDCRLQLACSKLAIEGFRGGVDNLQMNARIRARRRREAG